MGTKSVELVAAPWLCVSTRRQVRGAFRLGPLPFAVGKGPRSTRRLCAPILGLFDEYAFGLAGRGGWRTDWGSSQGNFIESMAYRDRAHSTAAGPVTRTVHKSGQYDWFGRQRH